jgi:Txe/YoeB family toxin of toxin-antitoxin system
MYKIIFTKQSQKDSRKLVSVGLKNNALKLLKIVEADPMQKPPPFEKLLGDLSGCYSRRINIKHRLVYQILRQDRIIKIIRMWSHYGDN